MKWFVLVFALIASSFAMDIPKAEAHGGFQRVRGGGYYAQRLDFRDRQAIRRARRLGFREQRFQRQRRRPSRQPILLVPLGSRSTLFLRF